MINAYVDVLALSKSDGKIVPKVIYWSDSKEYKITHYRMIGDILSMGGLMGTQYIVKINNQERKLYHERNSNRWFLDIDR